MSSSYCMILEQCGYCGDCRIYQMKPCISNYMIQIRINSVLLIRCDLNTYGNHNQVMLSKSLNDTRNLMLKLYCMPKARRLHRLNETLFKVQTSIPICKMPAETNAIEASMPPMNIFCSGGMSGSSGHAPPGHTGIMSSTMAGFITCSWSGIRVTPNTSLRNRDA